MQQTFQTLILLLFLLFFRANVSAQSYELKGFVYESKDGIPLSRVTIFHVKDGKYTMSEGDGSYSVDCSVGDTIKLSYVGCDSLLYIADGKNNHNFIMNVSSTLLDEVVLSSSAFSKCHLLHGDGFMKSYNSPSMSITPFYSLKKEKFGTLLYINIPILKTPANSFFTKHIRNHLQLNVKLSRSSLDHMSTTYSKLTYSRSINIHKGYLLSLVGSSGYAIERGIVSFSVLSSLNKSITTPVGNFHIGGKFLFSHREDMITIPDLIIPKQQFSISSQISSNTRILSTTVNAGYNWNADKLKLKNGSWSFIASTNVLNFDLLRRNVGLNLVYLWTEHQSNYLMFNIHFGRVKTVGISTYKTVCY